jgi:hypothetical protein
MNLRMDPSMDMNINDGPLLGFVRITRYGLLSTTIDFRAKSNGNEKLAAFFRELATLETVYCAFPPVVRRTGKSIHNSNILANKMSHSNICDLDIKNQEPRLAVLDGEKKLSPLEKSGIVDPGLCVNTVPSQYSIIPG